jgi:hypothetical protein
VTLGIAEAGGVLPGAQADVARHRPPVGEPRGLFEREDEAPSRVRHR